MKRIDWILERCNEWTEADARDIARQMVAQGLYDGEFSEKALEDRATADVRKLLKHTDENGVPLFGNIETVDGEGRKKQFYKQTKMFNGPADYQAVINPLIRQARQKLRRAAIWAEDCKRVTGTQIPLPLMIDSKEIRIEETVAAN